MNPQRMARLIEQTVADLELDLGDIHVLTEAASGPFVCTSLLAAVAGAESVWAVTRDSVHGTADEVQCYVQECAAMLGVAGAVEVSMSTPAAVLARTSLVTNLGFVRPLDRDLIGALAPDAAVALMVEPWEVRAEDIDLAACAEYGVPVAGTDERHPRLAVFEYLGPVALRLLLNAEVEVLRSHIALVSSEPFAGPIRRCLEANGARVSLLDPGREPDVLNSTGTRESLETCDALLVADYRFMDDIVGGSGIPVQWLAPGSIQVVHLCGTVKYHDLTSHTIRVFPPVAAAPRHMTVTTDYCGPRPVIDLHAGGLKVGEILVRARRRGLSASDAVAAATTSGWALPCDRKPKPRDAA